MIAPLFSPDFTVEPKLFVGMLPKVTVEKDLVDVFGKYGVVTEVSVLRGPDGQSKGERFNYSVIYVPLSLNRVCICAVQGPGRGGDGD